MKARLLLLAVLAVSVLMFMGGIKMLAFEPAETSSSIYGTLWSLGLLILLIPSPCMFLAAIVMLTFSFIKVSKDEYGNLIYSTKTLYWKAVSDKFENPGYSICFLFWQTVLLMFVLACCALFAVGILVVVVFSVFILATLDLTKLTFSLQGILALAGGGLFLLSLSWNLYFAPKKIGTVRRNYLMVSHMGMFLGVVILSFAAIFQAAEANKTTPFGAVGLLLGYIVLVVVSVTATYWILFGLFKLLSRLYNKVPKNLLDLVSQMVKGLCPVVAEAKEKATD